MVGLIGRIDLSNGVYKAIWIGYNVEIFLFKENGWANGSKNYKSVIAVKERTLAKVTIKDQRGTVETIE
jgi:hypothetical protein